MDFGFDLIHHLAGISTFADNVGIFLAKYLGYFVILFFVIGFFVIHKWQNRLYAFFFAILSVVLSFGVVKQIINYVWYIDRPFVAQGFTPLIEKAADASFPSGHATFFFTLAMVICLSMSARWGIIAFLAAILIGAGRVFVGVHYPIDILGGAVIGILVPLLVRGILPRPKKINLTTEQLPENDSDQLAGQ